MTSPLNKLRDLLNPQHPTFKGIITSVSHPNYRVLLSDGSGVTMCTSGVQYNLGATVFISNNKIERPAPSGQHAEIDL